MTTKEEKWIKSNTAKAHLLDLIRKKEIPEDMKPKQVFEACCKHRPEFELFGDNDFSSRLRSLRAKVTDQDDKAARDATALAGDRLLCPRPVMDGFGLPCWPDAEAKELLEMDVREGKHNEMTKEELFLSRTECSESIPYHVFIKWVHQEARTQKFHAHVTDKRNNKIAKQHIENMPFAK